MESTADIRLGDVDAPAPAVSIELTSTPVLSYALAHNRIPVVSRLALTSERTLRGLTVRLSVRDAEGPIAQTVELLADVDAGRTTVLTSIGLVMDPAAMLHVEEQRPGVVDVDVECDGLLLGEATAPVQVLAAAQWLATPLPLALEMLAAHVQPNHPAVAGLVADAAEILEERTGSGAMVGYAATAERVDEVVAALAAALHRRGVRHSEPPASWSDLGQQVRSPGDVLTWRVGTPLDTVVLLAAACERAGIRPLLWLAEGHSFLGYWREERSSESAGTTDAAPLVNLVDLGLIGLVDPTLLTGSAEPGPDLRSSAYDGWLTGDLDRVLGVTDVHRARRDGILPLPARARTPEGLLQVVEYSPGEHSAPSLPAGAATASAGTRPEAPARVQQWKNALLDLSLRNRLINYTERSGLPLTLPAAALPVLDNFVHDGTPVTLLPGDRLAAVHTERGLTAAAELPAETLTELLVERRELHADVTSGGYLPRLRNLAYRAKTVQEETGANNLYLALGSLVWELDGRPLRSPLVLVPVVLTPVGRTGSYRLSLDEAGSSTPNYCLLEKLRQVHGLVVPSLVESAEGTVEVEAALEAVRVGLVGHGLPYRVEATADLAILQFAKYRLWKDLDEHWADFARNPLVSHLVHQPTEPFADPAGDSGAFVDLDALAAELPVPADASQLRAVAEAGAGRTFVLEGPPGTGKSQTITNLLTRAVADGKRVLFVAEKRAALDVVARRLDAVGMGMFALDLHDKGSRASTVRAQIRLALDHAVAVDDQGLAVDSETLRSARRQLARYADRLHDGNAVGLSLYTARTAELTAGTDVEPLPVPLPFVADVPAEVLTAVRRALALLPDIADLTRPSLRHPWAFVDTPEIDLAAAREAAAEVDAAVREVAAVPELGAVMRHARTPSDLDALAHLLSGPPVGLDVLDETFSSRWTTATGAVVGEVAAFTAFRHPGLDVATPEALALPLADVYVRAQTAAASGWWGRRRRLTEVRDELAPCLKPGAKVRPADVPALVENLWRVQTAVRTIAARADSVPGLSAPADWNPFTDPALLQREVTWLRRAGAAVDGSSAFHVALRKLIVAGMPVGGHPAAAVTRLRDSLGTLLRVCGSSPDQLAEWCGDDGFVLRWSMTRPERGVEGTVLMSLRRWVSFLDTLEPLRHAGLFDARRLLVTGAIAADDAVRALDRGLAAASVTERLASTGLDTFDAAAHESAIARFTAASRAVREHLTAALPASVLGARPFDAAMGTGQVGALQRELAKQRRGLGVRQLLARYGELITTVMPCVLVSPDSVARFFPAAAGQFDLVVFDEASQIRVADAVGALGRARTAVVVGDSRQMPPTSFLEPSTASTDDSLEVETAVEDEESILSECVQARVPRHWLSWHYRSQDESLIAFSNAQYYGNRLSSFPAPTHGQASAEPDGRGVSLVRVPGTFHRSGAARLLRTNPVEAAAIVAEIRRRFDARPKWDGVAVVPSIGVVTFNAQQRACIEALLRDADDDRLAAALDRTDGEGLFVKNLENVQGDERDVIFFSTGFSPTADGTLPLNFGPLNRVGGERRLNVAITRARRQVVVFSSFDPAQLRAEETSSVGIKHLRAYLDMAERGTDVLPRSARSAAVVDRHREQIAAALRERGLVVRTDVGLSEFRIDLSVSRPADPETPLMAVLLDGPAWARRGTVGDRDAVPVEVLGDMLRWPVVQRVWLPTWLADPGPVVDRLVTAVDTAPAPSLPLPLPLPEPVQLPTAAVESFKGVAALRSSVTSMAVPATPARPAPKAAAPKPAAPAAPSAAVEGETPFVPWIPKAAGEKSVLDELPASKAARAVRRVLLAGIKAEGPIHVDRLSKLTVGAFGLTRATEARKQALLSLLPPSAVDGDYLWPEGTDRADWTGFRRQVASTDRPIEHVAPEEIANAMTALCRAAAGMRRDELLGATAAVFGYKRRAASVTPVLEKAMAAALDAGRLTEQGEGLLTP